MDQASISFRVTGRVQGVWFRGWTQREAMTRGLSGWVRNDPDGSVVGRLHGDATAVTGMVAALHVGPPSARVDAVETGPTPPEDGQSFDIRR